VNKILIKFLKSIFLTSTILFLFQSCNENKIIKYAKLNNNQTLKKGEWISLTDSLAGISIRGNKIAFFKKMIFNSEDICEYSIIDSIYKDGKSKRIIGVFLFVAKNKDTIKYRIIKRNEKSIILKSKNKTETYTFWR